MKYKWEVGDEAEIHIVDFSRNKRTKDAALISHQNFQPDKMYENGLSIKEKKLQDLMSLLKYIPPVHHEFYKKLRSDDCNDDVLAHPDLDDAIEDEVERDEDNSEEFD